MSDAMKVPERPSWYPGSEDEWRGFVSPVLPMLESAGQKSFSSLSTLLPAETGIDEGADRQPIDRYFQTVIESEDWQGRLHGMDRIFREASIRDASDVQTVSVMRFMARVTPETNRFLMTNALEREGFDRVEVPSLPAVLAGVVPAHLAKRSAFGFALEQISQQWYAGDLRAMAKDIGVDDFLLKSFISGKGLPKAHERVVHIAKRLGVDPDELDVLWFADKYRKDVAQFLQTESKASKRLRARMINRIAATRLGEQFRPPDVMENQMERAVDLAAFAMLARVHPRTAIPIVAARDEENWEFYGGVEEFAESLANERGKPWKAAVACYLAANHAKFQGKLKTIKDLVLQGNNYLRYSGDRLPVWLNHQQAAELRIYYLRRGLELYSAVAEHSPSQEATARISYQPAAVADITGNIQRLSSRLPQNVGDAYRASLESFERKSWARFERKLGGLTDGRRFALEQLRESYPDMTRLIVQSGRTSVIESAFQATDPDGDRDALPDLYFSRAVHSAAVVEGIIGDDFGIQNTAAEYIEVGDIVQFGGACLMMTNAGLVPMLPILSVVK